MKKFLLIVVFISFAPLFVFGDIDSVDLPNDDFEFSTEDVQDPIEKPYGNGEKLVPPKNKFKTKGDAMAFGLKRGVANLFCGWLEIPRAFSFEFTERPLSAPVTAPILGSSLTAIRMVQGGIDLLSAGFNGYFSYGDITTYPWEEPWLYRGTNYINKTME